MENFNFKTKPLDHQKLGFDIFKDKDYFALFCDMGTGKTKIMIDILSYQFIIGKIDVAIIVAPKAVIPNWSFIEIPKHIPIKYNLAQYRNPLKVRDKQLINELYQYKSKYLKIITINIDSIRTELGYHCISLFLNKYRCALFIDESTSIKSHSARVTKMIQKLGLKARTKAIATGYPSPKNILDYYTQMEFLKTGLSGCSKFFIFQHTYAETVRVFLDDTKNRNKSYLKVKDFKNRDKLISLLNTFSLRVKKEECMDLPETTDIPYIIEMTDEQWRAYSTLRKKAIYEIENSKITVASAITLIMKLHQITCGHAKLEDGSWINIKNKRLDHLKSLVNNFDSDEKILIWAHYRKDIENILNLFGKEAVGFYGNNDNETSLQKWRNNEARLLVLNPASGAFGLTLVESCINVYYSYSYNLEHWLQSRERTNRYGQKRKVQYYTFYTLKTVEPRIYDCLINKKQLGDSVLDNIKNYIK